MSSTTCSQKILITRLNNRATLPSYQTPGSAGADLTVALEQPIDLPSGERLLVPTGLAIAIPKGYEAQIRSRSGLALKHGVIILNSPATIDSDYRGELLLLLANYGKETFSIEPGMRVAQMIVSTVQHIQWHEVSELPADTQRGTQGYGSTGLL